VENLPHEVSESLVLEGSMDVEGDRLPPKEHYRRGILLPVRFYVDETTSEQFAERLRWFVGSGMVTPCEQDWTLITLGEARKLSGFRTVYYLDGRVERLNGDDAPTVVPLPKVAWLSVSEVKHGRLEVAVQGFVVAERALRDILHGIGKDNPTSREGIDQQLRLWEAPTKDTARGTTMASEPEALVEKALASKEVREPKLPKGKGVIISDFLESLPQTYWALEEKNGRRPTSSELAVFFSVDERTIQRRIADIRKRSGTWPPPPAV